VSIRLGWDPPDITVTVAAGGKWAAAIIDRAGDTWADADTIDLYFTGSGAAITWAATIIGDRAAWDKTVAQVATLIAADNRSVALRHTPAGGEPTIWNRGSLHVA
jgi:hypothetical protein